MQDIRQQMFVNDVQASERARFNVLHSLYVPLQLVLNSVLWVT